MIKAIIFDAGGVLFNSEESLFRKPIEYVAKITGQPLELVDKAYRETITECEREVVDKKDLWERLMSKLGLKIPFAGQDPIGEGFKHFRQNDEAFSIIEELKSKYKLTLVSNANAVEAAIARKLSLYNPFDAVVLSYKVGVRKPNPKIYQSVLERLQVKPEETLFIDNATENVDEAEKLGMIGILFKNADQLKKDLRKIGVVL